MTEQSIKTVLGISSTSDSPLMGGVSKKGHTGQAKNGDQSFHPVLTNSLEDRDEELNQSLVPMGQWQGLGSLTNKSKFSLEIPVNGHSLIMENRQALSGEGEHENGEVALLNHVINQAPDSEPLSTPIEEGLFLHLLFSGRGQGPNANIELLENPKELLETAIATKQSSQNSNEESSRNLSQTRLHTVAGGNAETPNNSPVSPLFTGIPKVQIEGSGALSRSNFGSNIGSEEPLPLTLPAKLEDTNPDTQLALPQSSSQRGEGATKFVLNSTDMLEKQTNQSNPKSQILDIEQTVKPSHTVNNVEKVLKDNQQQSLELLNTRAVKAGTSLVSEEGVKSNVLEQQLLRSFNNTIVQEISNAKPVVREGAGQKGKESGITQSVSKSGQLQEGVSSRDNDNINAFKPGVLATGTVAGDSVITEVQTPLQREEANQNLAYMKHDLEPRLQSLSSSKEISVNSTSGSLSTDMTDHIAQRAKLFLQGGKSEVRLQLSPPELGNLKLEFSVVDDVLEAKISVEKSMIKEIIEKDIPRIRDLLSQTDMDIGRLDVSLQEKEDSREDFMNKGSLSDTDRKSDGALADGDQESDDGEREEDVEQTTVNSSSINYLV